MCRENVGWRVLHEFPTVLLRSTRRAGLFVCFEWCSDRQHSLFSTHNEIIKYECIALCQSSVRLTDNKVWIALDFCAAYASLQEIVCVEYAPVFVGIIFEKIEVSTSMELRRFKNEACTGFDNLWRRLRALAVPICQLEVGKCAEGG